MLEPREADLPVLFLVLIVLPLVTYILLGKWSEAAKKKARISKLAQLASEDSFGVEPVSFPDAIPVAASPKVGFHECAKCFAPATTRCSRCKSFRYCSGKCQIIHWRQGHKKECREWQDSSHNLFPSRNSVPLWPSADNSKHFLGNDIEEFLCNDFLSDPSSGTSFTTTDRSHQSSSERKSPDCDNQVSHKLKTGRLRSDDTVASAFEDAMNYGTDTPTTHGSTLFTSLSSKDTSSGQRFATGNPSSIEIHRRQDTSSSIYGHSPTGETSSILTPSRSIGNSGYVITNKNETGLKFSSEDGFFSVTETVDSEDFPVRDNIMFKRPPYTLGPTSQKSAEKIQRDYHSQGLDKIACMDKESRVSAMSVPTSKPSQNCNGLSNNGGTKITGSKKSSKVHKCNHPGVLNDCSKNKMLFPYEDLVKFFQCEIWGISPRGILNCGNSCYANAVLQCLTCTKPLMVYLLRRSHSKTCRIRDWCLMCELEHHVLMLREGGGPLSPIRILSNMRNIGSRMGGGNQEDAHEFLRLLVMSMQSICLEGVGGEKEVNPRLQETTLIQQIFGGRLKSKVKCLRCHLESERYEHIMDLTLEIHGWVESLEDALTQFTAPEDLDGENMYKCGRCSAYVKARKQLSVYEVPNVLTIVLKRFQTGKYGKINKCVTFPEMLDMIPFVTGLQTALHSTCCMELLYMWVH
ncbi:putative ubiquitin carboxyl-terminal hydrolase 15 [Iris pallida]|uniref:Ubiquitin carboxyl-terminal hydrolase 15 n=1 Tax=Iris pallida TaxID=29817 RepID=A0AAX6DPQ8_IRIPA|nr:putative ubiquitin carboxyl-terminal hydrolase 15 [Iris pallida]